MGDRANFVFVQDTGETIVLYGHWAGYNMLENLAEAVAAAQPRWSDSAYATRIAISQIINNDWNRFGFRYFIYSWSCFNGTGCKFLFSPY